jgi:hypothetical protein
MSTQPIPFGGNASTSVVKQGKYRVVHHKEGFAIEVVIETPDNIRSYPTSRAHPLLVEMVNRVKVASDGREGGPFYINEWHQVIVPVGDPVKYFFAGEYHQQIVLSLDGVEFSGRPHDDTGNLLKPGDPWIGRPRPGIGYKLKAGGADVEYTIELSPGREKFVRLSQAVGQDQARRTARKVSAIKGNSGGRFYINEYRAIFGPQQKEDGYHYVFIGMLTEQDAWFPKWTPNGPVQATPPPASTTPVSPPIPTVAITTAPVSSAASPTEPEFRPVERKVEIADGDTGHSMDSLYGAYLRGASIVRIEDTFLIKPHQIANLLRFCELLVRIGTVRTIKVVTKVITDDSRGRLETIRRSLKGYNVDFTYEASSTMHDRQIVTDMGWEISLGRGLDIYKCPEDFLAVGATDFALRPCYQTTILFHRLGNALAVGKTA